MAKFTAGEEMMKDKLVLAIYMGLTDRNRLNLNMRKNWQNSLKQMKFKLTQRNLRERSLLRQRRRKSQI
jgi:hypothetical protein